MTSTTGAGRLKRRHTVIAVTRASAGLASLVLVTATAEISQTAASALPARLEHYLTSVVRLTAEERSRLDSGAAITKLLDADPSKEVAVFGAIWINAPVRRYVDFVKDIENFERGRGFVVTKRISDPPRLEDFAQLRLTDEDVNDLRICRVGACKLKLGEQAIQRFRTDVDWRFSTAGLAANSLMRRFAFDYVTAYLDGGNERLAVYRDNSRPTSVAGEFRDMIEQMPELTTFMPDMRRSLLESPKVQRPDSTSFLYWQETVFGLKPTLRISHLTIREGPDDTVMTSKMLYASHYFWTGLELRALIPDLSRGAGFWFVSVNRIRADGLSGFTGLFVRRRVRSEGQEGTLTVLQRTKQRLEAFRKEP